MLPKVATHILHQTSRAAAAVQNQTTHTLRNVLQLQSSPNPSSSTGTLAPWNGTGSSNWGNNGPGPGGAKYNTGSRFHPGYAGASRAMTQANPTASSDGTFAQSDDTDEPVPIRVTLAVKRPRMRSHSLSLSGRHERGEKLGVLETVQLHARSRHAFAAADTRADSPANLVAAESSSRHLLVRRNSTSAPTEADLVDEFIRAISPPPPPQRTSTYPEFSDSIDPATPQTVSPPPQRQGASTTPDYKALRAAHATGDSSAITTAVLNFRAKATSPTIQEFNAALEALLSARRPGEPLNLILETYNDMLARSLLPNMRTYFTLLYAFTDRDHEIQKIITSMESRAKSRALAERHEAVLGEQEANRIKELRSENNFSSSMALFEALLAVNSNARIPGSLYHNLLRSCAYHGSVDGAIHVYAQLEQRKDIKPTAAVYSFLISVYTNVGDLEGAKTIFAEYQTAADAGRISRSIGEADFKHGTYFAQLYVWNKMIEAYFRCGEPDGAIILLERMLDSKAGSQFTPADVPPPASSTFTQVIAGFCQSGDIKTALAWFDRLLQQKDMARNPLESQSKPTRPDQTAWLIMIETLASQGMVEDLNRLFSILVRTAQRDCLQVRLTDRLIVFNVNFERLQSTSDKAAALKMLDFLVEDVANHSVYGAVRKDMVEQMIKQYLELEQIEQPITIVEQFVIAESERLFGAGNAPSGPAVANHTLKGIRDLVTSVAQQIYDCHAEKVPFFAALRLARLLDNVFLVPSRVYAPYLLHAYGLAKRASTLPTLVDDHWQLLASAATALELPPMTNDLVAPPKVADYAFQGLTSLLEDIATNMVNVENYDRNLMRRIVTAMHEKYGANESEKIFTRLGISFQRAYAQVMRTTPSLSNALVSPVPDSDSTVRPRNLVVDMYHSRFVDEFFRPASTVSPHVAYQRFAEGLKVGKVPTPLVMARLIMAMGRLNDLERVHRLYSIAQEVIMSLETNKKWQLQSWFTIEDSMVIALAHGGDVDAAHVHRARILEQGGAPSADGYGALIQYVKDTTDDTSNAMMLFEEAQAKGVRPNIYLYNNIISKLAKARKADFALELFQQMRASGVRPSSITYGALIGACSRVGDSQSAESLFAEMVAEDNFKPRIPPYNTMMQLYTSTKPNRERAAHYFNAIREAGIAPTAHTYKLLMDAYGTIEPIDLQAVERVFKELEANDKVQIAGAHWASLINAYGCAAKDLDKAIAIFESIPDHEKSKAAATLLPDAVVYEAIINVFVVHRRIDLMEQYAQRLRADGVRMTAYITNFLIRGFALAGDLDRARAVFESLADPPLGVAAPNNHIPHDSTHQPAVPVEEPVYREPSTWEAMVRAELGAGNRDRAVELLERLQNRQFPEGVYNRIKGIMLDDDSVSPWSSETASTASS